MKYTELTVTVPSGALDALCARMTMDGFDSYEIYDYNDLEDAIGQVFYDYIDESLLEQKGSDPKLKIYFDADSGGELLRLKALLDALSQEEEFSLLSYECAEGDTEDWENNWKQYFYPFPVGDQLYVKPTWLEADGEESRGRRILEIDPASAFGSGTHATTKLCLEYLEQYLKHGDKVLDMGCGSGILGIGALALGAGSVHAVDIDENAVRVAGENFLSNGCDPASFTLSCGDALSDPDYAAALPEKNDVILANIVAAVIVGMAPLFFRKLCGGGTLVASGILSQREEEVKEALRSAGFEVLSSRILEDWAAIVCKKTEEN